MSRIKNSLPARLQAFLANDKTRVLLGMSKQRMLVVNAFIVFLVANSLFDIALDEQHWPFAQYDMYSDVEREYSVLGLNKSHHTTRFPCEVLTFNRSIKLDYTQHSGG